MFVDAILLSFAFFVNDPPTTEIYTYCHTLSLHDALPIGVRQGRPERAGGRGPAVAADRWADGWRHAGVRAGIGNWGLGIGTSGFAPALRFHESLIPNSQSRLLREHLAQEPEQLAERMRRLVALALVERVAHQLAPFLAVGRRVRFDQLRRSE